MDKHYKQNLISGLEDIMGRIMGLSLLACDGLLDDYFDLVYTATVNQINALKGDDDEVC